MLAVLLFIIISSYSSYAYDLPYNTKIKEWKFLNKEPDIKLQDVLKTEESDPYQVITNLMERVLGGNELIPLFKLELINVTLKDNINDKKHPFWNKVNLYSSDIIELDNDGKYIILRGTSISALAIAFNWYLQDICNTTYDWHTFTINLPNNLPLPLYQQKRRSVPLMYFENTCTSSYTFAFFSWSEWEKLIDWMVMQGINIPLAFTGQEYIWAKTFNEFGFNTSSLSTFFCGPGFYAWQRMGNIQGWAGPIRESEIISQYNLQLKILSRMYSFNIEPILTCFAGHVPKNFKEIYPNSSVIPSPQWAGFPNNLTNVLLLNSTDPLFTLIASKFIEIQSKYYGLYTNLYQCDTFNEMNPPSNNTNYLKQISSEIYKSMTNININAIWLIQSWLFSFSTFWNNITVKAYLSGVPNKGMIILDLQSEVNPQYLKYNSYFGKSFIWNTLHNPGGRNGIEGNLPAINNGFISALNYPLTTIIGIGISMEGIWQNYINYDFTLKMGFKNKTVNITKFGIRYGYRRYGPLSLLTNNSMNNAWLILVNTIYSINSAQAQGSLTCSTPSFGDGNLDHDPMIIQNVWKYFISIIGQNNSLKNIKIYQYDLIDITRQALSDIFWINYNNFTIYYKNKNINKLQLYGNKLINILNDMDNILLTNKLWMVGTWIEMARNQTNDTSNNNDTKNWYEFNARNQITLWGPSGQINNYASKQWGDIIGKYYKPQWQLFINQVIDCIKNNKTFNQNIFYQQIYNQIEAPYQLQQGGYNINIKNNTLIVACDIYKKWNLNGDTSCL